ncbi:hypothetical protein CQA66_03830 [Helicobacter aurati]|uniref:Glycosyltransferase RgtA/B/C/D-like domain-containing protein n=1 Tax=Helicobacter aurati TaxID=137778 RepID=A0A3D8J5G5_9HELI|nr:hypothetical protein [Helicobacter aurati]RDU72732.1 hypothetical protein CQA66_03830 [Helicobacter aurati]
MQDKLKKLIELSGNRYFFCVFVLVYLLGVICFANFGVIDDHTLTNTLLIDKSIPIQHHIMINIGRFFPLNGQDLNILSFIFAAKPIVFYTFNAVCIVIVIIALHYVVCGITEHILNSMNVVVTQQMLKCVAAFCIILLLIAPAFIQSYLRLFVPERMEFVFLSFFLACYTYILRMNNNANTSIQAFIVLFIGICCANIALYYKETTFILLGAFGFCHLIAYLLFSSNKNGKLILFDIALVLSSCVWVIVYYLIVFSQKQTMERYGGQFIHESFKIVSKIFYTLWKIFLNETFLMVSLILCCSFLLVTLIKKRYVNPLLVALTLASMAFIAGYVVLGIFPANHYMLPCYIFALPLFCVSILFARNLLVYRWLLIASGVYFIVAVLPNSLLLFGHYKLVPNNFQNCVRFLSEYTMSHPHTKIYLKDINPVAGVEIYVSFDRWLKFYGAQHFDLDSVNMYDPSKQYNAGDIIVVPYAYSASIQEFLSKPSNYELLYASPYNVDIPNLSLRNLIRLVKYQVKSKNVKNVGQFSDYSFYVVKIT